jgi:hypothetical protein
MNNKASNIPLLAAFGIGLIFMWLVGYGWYRTFNSWTGNEFVAIPVGIVFALIAVTLALAIAKERTVNPSQISTVFSYFFILILLSALGTINTLYFNFSGVSISQNAIKTAIEKVSTLRNRAPSLLATPEYDDWVRKVERSSSALLDEIDNPKLCGQGPEAMKRIAELQLLLPAFRQMAGAGGCEKRDLLKSHYKEIISKQIELSENQLKFKAKLDAKIYIEKNSQQIIDKLTELQREANAVSDIKRVQQELEDASSNYGKLKDLIESVTEHQFDKSFTIDTSAIKSIGNVGDIFGFIASRFNEVNTIFYILIAILIDLTLIAAFKAVISNGESISNNKYSRKEENYI